MSFLFNHWLEKYRNTNNGEVGYPGVHTPLTDDVLAKLAGEDKFYVVSTKGLGYLRPDGTHFGASEDYEPWHTVGVDQMRLAHQWLGKDLPDASVLEGYVLRKVRNQPGVSRRKPLRFDPRQFRAFPFRPRPFFKHDYVLHMTPWFVENPPASWYVKGKGKGKGKCSRLTGNVHEATRFSVEQVAYLQHCGAGGTAWGMPVPYETAVTSDQPYKFIDVRRLPDAPDRMGWCSDHYTCVENKRKSKRHVQKPYIYKDNRTYRTRIMDYILGRKPNDPYTVNLERIT